MDKKNVLNLIIGQGMLSAYYHPDADVSVQILKAMYRAGIRVIEYTNRGETAWQNFIQIRKIADKELPGLLLGAGTIKNKIAATEFVNEGADFIVCPGTIEEVATLVHRNDLLWIPSCLTTTEIIAAENLNAKLIKLFPGNSLGPSYIGALKEIFPDLLFMPTGGVETNDENLSAWFKDGVCAVDLGTSLISNDAVATRDYATIESSARNALEIVRRVRKS